MTPHQMINKKKQGFCKMGEGPVIAYASAVQQNLRDLIVSTAETKKYLFKELHFQEQQGLTLMLLLCVMEQHQH